MSDTNNHKCIERAVDSDCPICNEYLFNSPKSVMFMQCGHSIHLVCFEELKKTSYRCPLCNKSCVNMEYHFRQLDMQILQQPMPLDYADARAVISCNDCSAKSQTAFHWLGLKCAVCKSYNTTQLQLLNMPGGTADQPEQPQQGQQQPVSLDPAFLAEELRQRNRAAARRREQSRQREQDTSSPVYQGFGLLSTSPSSFSPAFLLRLLNRTATPSAELEQTATASSSSPLPPARNPTIATAAATAAAAASTSSTPAFDRSRPPSSGAGAGACSRACDSSEDEDDEDQDDDMLDLFGARDRDFDRMTGLTSAESVVGFDDDDEEDEESSEGESGDEEGEEDDEEEDEDEEDDILLLGHR